MQYPAIYAHPGQTANDCLGKFVRHVHVVRLDLETLMVHFAAMNRFPAENHFSKVPSPKLSMKDEENIG